MKRLTLAFSNPASSTSPVPTTSVDPLERGSVHDRLEALRALFEKNRHRYSFRRRAAIEDMLSLAFSDLHVNALDEALNAWLPRIETFDYPQSMFPHAMAA